MPIAKIKALLTLIILGVAVLSAQTGTTSLTGTVTDPGAALLPGVQLTLSNPQTGFSREVKSNGQGVYRFLQVPPATYELTVSASGFATQKQSHVVLMVSTPETIDISMRVAGTASVVEVIDTTPMVNT